MPKVNITRIGKIEYQPDHDEVTYSGWEFNFNESSSRGVGFDFDDLNDGDTIMDVLLRCNTILDQVYCRLYCE